MISMMLTFLKPFITSSGLDFIVIKIHHPLGSYGLHDAYSMGTGDNAEEDKSACS